MQRDSRSGRSSHTSLLCVYALYFFCYHIEGSDLSSTNTKKVQKVLGCELQGQTDPLCLKKKKSLFKNSTMTAAAPPCKGRTVFFSHESVWCSPAFSSACRVQVSQSFFYSRPTLFTRLWWAFPLSQVSDFIFHCGSDLLQSVTKLHFLSGGVLLQRRDDLVVVFVDVLVQLVQCHQVV